MTGSRDVGDVQPIDPFTAERLLGGAVRPDDAPPGYADVARVLDAVRAPTTHAVAAPRTEADTVAAMAAAIRAAGESTPSPRRHSMLAKLLTTKAVAVAGALTLGMGVAAAATGTMPDPVQRTVSDAASHLGLELPSPDDSTDVVAPETEDTNDTTDATDVETEDTTPGPDVTGSAKDGLCNAWEKGGEDSHGKRGESTAFRALQSAADDAGTDVATFCADDSVPPVTPDAATDDSTDDHGGRPTTAGPKGSTGSHGDDATVEDEHESEDHSGDATVETEHEDGDSHDGSTSTSGSDSSGSGSSGSGSSGSGSGHGED